MQQNEPYEKRTIPHVEDIMEPQSLVLVIDDDDAIRTLFVKCLTRMNLEVIAVENGQAALDAIADRLPAVILLDMRMPVMDGNQFLHQLEERGMLMIPVILCSAEIELSTDLKAVQIVGYLDKPFELETLEELVKRALDIDQQRRLSDRRVGERRRGDRRKGERRQAVRIDLIPAVGDRRVGERREGERRKGERRKLERRGTPIFRYNV